MVLFHEEVVVSGEENILDMFFLRMKVFLMGFATIFFIPVECVRVCLGSSFLKSGKNIKGLLYTMGQARNDKHNMTSIT